MNPKIEISVIICTYNRCECLKDVIDSLFIQDVGNGLSHEVVVVDNNSKDNTKGVIDDLVPKSNGKIRYVFEKNQGLSYARNRGILEAKGDIVAFIDDDALACENWLSIIYESFRNRDCDVVGGKIVLNWPKSPPVWLTKRFYKKLGFLDYGNSPFQIKDKSFEIFGGNFAVKKKLFDKIGYFNTSLGRKGKQLFAGEETELFHRILSAGNVVWYEPGCVIQHKVGIEKLNKSFFRKCIFCDGQTDFNIGKEKYKPKDKKYLLGVPYWLILRFSRICMQYLKKNVNKNAPDEKFASELEVFYHLGMITAAYRQQ